MTAPVASQEPPSVKVARGYLGLTESGAAMLMRASVTGKLPGGVATDKLVSDGFARRFVSGVSKGWGKPATMTPKGHEAVRVLNAAGWRWPRKR